MDQRTIRNIALQNAIKYEGRANQGTVISHLLASHPELKSNIKELAKDVAGIIKEISSLSVEQQRKELEQHAPGLLVEEERGPEKRELKPLQNTDHMVMRFEPSPSGPLHVGHSYVLSLNAEYCRKYNGKLILRISDTNPENIDPGAYDMIPRDAKWLTRDLVSEVIVQSDRMDVYYRYFDQLLELGGAYICTCDSEKYKELNLKSEACPCRELPKQEQIRRWKMMFDGYKPGEAVARVKTNLNDKNPAMRDFPVIRVNESPHPRQGTKYRVWPLMNWAVVVDDMDSHVTHMIRAKDHADNAKRQEYVYRYFNKPIPTALFVGRINFEMPLSTTQTRLAIEAGTYTGWDDIELPFIPALQRRGYQAESFVRYALDIGVSLADKSVTKEDFFKALNAHNKDIIDKASNRYFFIENPKQISIKGAPSKTVQIPLHLEDPARGSRTMKTGTEFYVQDDIETGRNYRFMHLFNFKDGQFVSEGVDDSLKARMIHWLPVTQELVRVEILMPDKKILKGYGEPDLKNVKAGEIVQFERFAFCRLDAIEGNVYKFWFTHK